MDIGPGEFWVVMIDEWTSPKLCTTLDVTSEGQYIVAVHENGLCRFRVVDDASFVAHVRITQELSYLAEMMTRNKAVLSGKAVTTND